MNSTILVADSDYSICTMIRDVLTARGYLVETASSLATAAAFVARNRPDLILLALDLDGEDGRTLIPEIDEFGETIPVVLLVDGGFDNPVDAVSECGALTYLKKPVERNRLLMVAKAGIESGKNKRAVQEQARDISRAQTVLHAMLDSGDGAFFLLDQDANIVDCGGDLTPYVDVPNTDLKGRPYLSVLPGSTAKLHAGGIAEVRAGRQAVRLEEERAGGVFEALFKPVHDQNELSGFVVRLADVTALRQTETELAESEKRCRSVFEGGRDPIVLIERQSGNVIKGNSAAAQAIGYGVEELDELSLQELVLHPDRTMQAVDKGVKRIALESFRRKDGSSFPVELSLSYFTVGGKDVCILYAQDISRRQIVEEALREGARLYRAVVEDQTELICRYAPDGKLTFVNGAYARFFGEDEDEAVGTDSYSTLSSLDKRSLLEWLSRVDSRNAVFDKEALQERADGVSRWIQWTNRAVLNERHEVMEIQAVGRDVTDRKNAEQALSQANLEKEQYRLNLIATFKSIPDAIVTVDTDLLIMASNRAAATLFNYDKGRMRGLDLEKLVDGEANPCVSVLKQVLKTNKPVRGYEIELDNPSLGRRMVEINCSPLIDQDKRHIGAVLLVRDVSHIADLEKQLQQRQGFRGIVGSSSTMQDIYQLLEQLSSLDSIVLILGESGTGKELVAEALHYGGARAGQPLIKVNCSALSESLLESELFGHVRGAFTGAVRDKVGRIQAAQGGTLFLDEIGDISPLLQLKLLRFLEQKEYERVGESRTYSADVRIIAATNVDLLEAVRQGSFREDLYYRLNVMPVTIPPLRERQADIPQLVAHFLGIFSEQFGKQFDGVSNEVTDLFMGYPWPGNIRELRHALEHACILSPGKTISLKHIRKDLVAEMDRPVAPPSVASDFHQYAAPQMVRKPGRDDILAALQQCGGNKVRAAQQLGIHRATLYRKLKAWGLDA